MKKGISIILLAALFIGCLSACTGHPVSKAATVEGAIFSGLSNDKIPVKVAFDAGWLTKRDNKSYNPELAQFCALLSADSYFRQKDYEKQCQNRVLFDDFNEPDYDFTSFLSNFGFAEAEHFESFRVQKDPSDPNDSATLTIGHQTVSGKFDVYAVVIRGAFSAQEWMSGFDPGCGSEEYEKRTGSHPDWTNKDHFKGVDVGATRALSFIKDYMEKTGDASLPDRILITGHSRGGGIANLLGAYFEKNTDIVSYTYAFNPIRVTCSGDAQDYKTIFNIYDSGDLFEDYLPFSDRPFTRYGKDLFVSVSDSEEIQNGIAQLKGRNDYTGISAETFEAYRSLFAQRFPSRDMLFNTKTITHTYPAKKDADTAKEECLQLIGAEEGLGLSDLCTVGEVSENTDGTYSLPIEYCGAALLRSYAMILAYGEKAYTPVITFFAEDELGCRIASFFLENAAAINGGHLLINSYVIAGTFK